MWLTTTSVARQWIFFSYNLLGAVSCMALAELKEAPQSSGLGTTNARFQWSPLIGGPHGTTEWIEQRFNMESPPKRISQILMWCGDRLDGLSITYADRTTNGGQFPNTETLGPYGILSGNPDVVLTLSTTPDVEYIIRVDGVNVNLGRGSQPDHTRIAALQFTTSNGQIKGCGKVGKGRDKVISWNYPGMALAFTKGKFGNEIDQITGAFISVDDY